MSRLDGQLRRLERVRPPICPTCRIDHTQPPRITADSVRPWPRGERIDLERCPACRRPRIVTLDLTGEYEGG